MTLVLAALQVLNIFVVTLSGFGLVSTSLLIYGLIQVSWQLNVIRHFNLIIIELLFDLGQKMSWCLMPWIVSVSCTTLVDLIYAVYLLAHTVQTLNNVRESFHLQLHSPSQ